MTNALDCMFIGTKPSEMEIGEFFTVSVKEFEEEEYNRLMSQEWQP